MALFDLNVDWILQTEKVAGGMWRHIDWVCIRRNKKREVVVGVVCVRGGNKWGLVIRHCCLN